MSAVELQGWREFYRLEPFGSSRDNWHSAVIASLLANAHRSKSTPASKVEDFMYMDSQTRRERDEQAVLAWFEQHSVDDPN